MGSLLISRNTPENATLPISIHLLLPLNVSGINQAIIYPRLAPHLQVH